MLNKFLLISDAKPIHLDEGGSNLVDRCFRGIKAQVSEGVAIKINTGKISRELFGISSFCPDLVLYIPSSSHTFNSFLRAKMLKVLHPKAKVVILAVQHREYMFLFRWLLRFLRPDLLLLLSRHDKMFFEKIGMRVSVLPPAVDSRKFCPVDDQRKLSLRKKYSLPQDKLIVLHVGHIKPSRNLFWLVDVQGLDNTQVVVVGSTSTRVDAGLKKALEANGICIINEYLPHIEEIYQVADIYVFPVIKKDAAIDMPLSALEAMACNLFVITTRFGGLVDYFQEDAGLRYVGSKEEVLSAVKSFGKPNICNVDKIRNFGWDNFAETIARECEALG